MHLPDKKANCKGFYDLTAKEKFSCQLLVLYLGKINACRYVLLCANFIITSVKPMGCISLIQEIIVTGGL